MSSACAFLVILFELIYLRLPAGGGNQNPALDFVLQKLATAMNRGSVAHVVADGKPLPSDRLTGPGFFSIVAAMKDLLTLS